jgi:protease-4
MRLKKTSAKKEKEVDMLYVPQRRRDDGFMKRILGFFKWFFIVMGVSVTLGFVASLLALGGVLHPVQSWSSDDNVLLTYTFKSGLAESAGGPSLTQPLLRPSTTFTELINRLTEAAKDKHVKGFVVRLQDESLAPAQLQELRDTLATFRAAGKFTYIYADDYGGSSSGMGAYYLASAFGQVWLQPMGEVSINGVAAEVPFFKGILDKVGVEAEFSRKGTYKSMPESLTLTGMSAPNREMTTGMVNDLADQLIAGIAASRSMTAEAVKQLVDNAPYSGDEAKKLKLIDKIGYYDQMLEEAKRKAGVRDGGTLSLSDYESHDEPKTKSRIALIIGAGDIVSYKDTHAGLSGSDMPADKIARAFEDARKDKNVVAVVFRIDSPGGSPEAAETIRHAIVETQQKGKPVIVSMSGYAASGGYWIASPADKIVAEPATITGSIGVFGGKFVLAGLWQKLGVHWDSVAVGDNARMWSSNAVFTDLQRQHFESLLDDIYQGFIARVAQGRKLTPAQVESVAEGHVWTGRQAKDRGLVDELGGLDKAVVLAKAAAKINPAQEIPLERFPAKKSPLEELAQFVNGSDDDDDDDASILSLVGISAGDILRSLQTQALSVPEIQLR